MLKVQDTGDEMRLVGEEMGGGEKKRDGGYVLMEEEDDLKV